MKKKSKYKKSKAKIPIVKKSRKQFLKMLI